METDRARRKSVSRVRKGKQYGQSKKKERWPSPKRGAIRTEQEERALAESEKGSNMDRASRKRVGGVRKGEQYGQSKKKERWWSPKRESKRTEQAEKALAASEKGSLNSIRSFVACQISETYS
ncbi:hypothetical protein [Bacillus alkalicellulosilyticus]|uniref:hypothetical protein n=1 Tax=Alkalihalobacterium alkalicellulosilyticum TaxID=1912214 RepID=UPI000996A0FC|nr:hypothetical protein [Bacillus alkalicellulosilyticus]